MIGLQRVDGLDFALAECSNNAPIPTSAQAGQGQITLSANRIDFRRQIIQKRRGV